MEREKREGPGAGRGGNGGGESKSGPAGSEGDQGREMKRRRRRPEKERQRARQHAGLTAMPRLSLGPRDLCVPSRAGPKVVLRCLEQGSPQPLLLSTCPSDALTGPVEHPEVAGGHAKPFCPPPSGLGLRVGSPQLWIFGGVDGAQQARSCGLREGEQRDTGV